MLPAQPALESAAKPLAPWERSPTGFDSAPTADNPAPWPGSNTGPMYVWNPNATTAPFRVIADDSDSDDGQSG
jgi:hypothetical protein